MATLITTKPRGLRALCLLYIYIYIIITYKETNLVNRQPSLLLPRLPNRKTKPQWIQEGQNVFEKVSISLLSLSLLIHVLATSVLTCCGAHRLQK